MHVNGWRKCERHLGCSGFVWLMRILTIMSKGHRWQTLKSEKPPAVCHYLKTNMKHLSSSKCVIGLPHVRKRCVLNRLYLSVLFALKIISSFLCGFCVGVDFELVVGRKPNIDILDSSSLNHCQPRSNHGVSHHNCVVTRPPYFPFL